MNRDFRLIYPYSLFKNYDKAFEHFKTYWRHTDGRYLWQLTESGDWPPKDILRPEGAVYNGETWLLVSGIQKTLTRPEAKELMIAQRTQQIVENIAAGKALKKTVSKEIARFRRNNPQFVVQERPSNKPST